MTTNLENQQITEQSLRRSVQEQPKGPFSRPLANNFVFSLATVADSFFAWGMDRPEHIKARDRQLRQFWPTEPILASAIGSMVTRNVTFSWTLTGPRSTVDEVQQRLHMSDLGRGWRSLIGKLSIDLFTQDNGAFGEIIRTADAPDAPVISLGHLDAGRCTRTGDIEIPVLYEDIKGRIHEMKWYQVFTWEELPSPIETMHNVQLCAVSRVLRAAQLLRDIGIYQREKIAGNAPTSIYLTNGVNQAEISDALAQHQANQANAGMVRYIVPLILAGVDPSVPPSVEEIALKSLPDGFDVEQVMRWYINQLALGFGADYQDFAPLPGGNLGTSTQSVILHEKSKGKGPGGFMQMVEYTMNFQGVIPQNVSFQYMEQDTMAEKSQADLFNAESDALKKNVEAGILTPRAATQILLDKGFITEEVFDLVVGEMAGLVTGDVTPDVVAEDDEDITNKATDEKERKKRRKRRWGRNYDTKEPTAFESLPAFGEDTRIEAEEELLRRVMRVFDATLEDFERQIGTKGFKSWLWGRKADPEEVFLSGAFWQGFRERLFEVGEPFARKVALDAANLNIGIGLGVNMDLVNERVLEFSRTYTNTWIDQLEATSKKQLQGAIVQWQETGLGQRGLPDLVDAITPTFGRTRAELIAANEVTKLFDEGNNLSHIAAGILEEEWQTSEDAHVEEICIGLNGQRFPVNEGPRPVRDTHIGCRCARLPVGNNNRVIRRSA